MNDQLKFFHYKRNFTQLKKFEIDQLDLQKYINSSLGQNEDRLLSRHYIGMLENTIISIICISASIIIYEDMESPIEQYPKDTELPTIKIGRLAVDKKYQKKGYGAQTLKKCISIFVEISKKIGVIGLTVDSKKDSVTFYEKFGFIKLKQKNGKDYTPMILYTKTIKEMNPNLFEDPV